MSHRGLCTSCAVEKKPKIPNKTLIDNERKKKTPEPKIVLTIRTKLHLTEEKKIERKKNGVIFS